jgi:hypothetical protein
MSQLAAGLYLEHCLRAYIDINFFLVKCAKLTLEVCLSIPDTRSIPGYSPRELKQYDTLNLHTFLTIVTAINAITEKIYTV